MQTTHCSAVVVDSAISHLHADILKTDAATGVTPTVIARPPISTDTTRDGLGRAADFLAESANVAAADLRKEAEGGVIFLHTSGSTGTSLLPIYIISSAASPACASGVPYGSRRPRSGRAISPLSAQSATSYILHNHASLHVNHDADACLIMCRSSEGDCMAP